MGTSESHPVAGHRPCRRCLHLCALNTTTRRFHLSPMVASRRDLASSDFGMGLLGANCAKSLSLSIMSMSSVTPLDRLVALQEIFAMAGNGSLQPVLDEIVPLEDASVAHEKLESGEVFGKIMLGVSR